MKSVISANKFKANGESRTTTTRTAGIDINLNHLALVCSPSC